MESFYLSFEHANLYTREGYTRHSLDGGLWF